MEEENKPFNDVIDHMNKVEGNALNPAKGDFEKLPKPLKYFGYFVFGFFAVSMLLIFILYLFD
ncbi:hypothetical protein [Paenisporosarcina indica]|uniref:hypothetical protein n=1 Tax=Paenisporosarcina indica TaxID=650093 RepID=UPI00094F9A75|nr:hypothetical protein [Paenisporosarcina indica]